MIRVVFTYKSVSIGFCSLLRVIHHSYSLLIELQIWTLNIFYSVV